MQASEAVPHGGRCAVLGRPNAGKSTLINGLMGERLFAVTPKAGTTRYRAMGLMHWEDPPTQIAFVDTPGVATRSRVLEKALREEARAALQECDVVLALLDGPKALGKEDGAPLPDEDSHLLDELAQLATPFVVAINKVDRVRPRQRLLPFLEALAERYPSASAYVPISATRGTGVPQLVEALRNHLPEGSPYPPDMLTDRPMRFFALEAIREALLLETHREVPHGSAVRIDVYHEGPRHTRIEATLFVERDAHKGIVIGEKGQRLKAIGIHARELIEGMIGRDVVLKLFVKLAKDWTQSPASVHAMRDEELGAS